MEAALELGQVEYRQALYLFERVVVDASVPYRPVLAHLVEAFHKVLLEVRGRFLGKDVVQSLADVVDAVDEGRVVSGLFERIEVHVDLELGQRTGHELSVTAEDVASGRLDRHTVFFL